MSSTLPTPVQGYITTSNAFDGDADRMVRRRCVRQRRPPRVLGKQEIRAWLDRELIGDKVTMDVTATSEHYGDVIVHAVMNGEYDKTGLPDPLVLTHYFTVREDRIVRLIIILNEPTPPWAKH